MSDEPEIKIEEKAYSSVQELFDDIGASWTFWDRIDMKFHRWVKNPIRNAYWWIQHRFNPRHRYNVVRTGFPANYYDTDLRMEGAIVRLLLDFIEHEKPWEFEASEENLREVYVDFNGTVIEERVSLWLEIQELYAYFKGIDLLNPPWEEWSGVREMTREERNAKWNHYERLKKEFTAKLCRVVELRGYMWT